MTNEELVLRYENGDKRALDELYLQLQPFIYFVVKDVMKSFSSNDLDLKEELFQVGAAELVELVNKRKYDVNKGGFTTYIKPYLRAAMIRHIEKFITPVSITHNDLLNIRKCQKLHEEGKSDETIASELNISKRLVEKYLRFSFKTESIILRVQDEYGEEYIENPELFINALHTDNIVYRMICSELLKKLFDKLSLKERRIIGNYYGVYGYEKMSVGDIANFELITKDAVEKKKREAMEKLYYWYHHFSELKIFREAYWVVCDELGE